MSESARLYDYECLDSQRTFAVGTYGVHFHRYSSILLCKNAVGGERGGVS